MAVKNPLSGVPIRAARWSALHPWRAILGWLAFVVLAVSLAVAVPTQETEDADYRVGESGRADAIIEDAGLDDPTTENVLIQRGDAPAEDAEAAAAEITAGMRAIDGVEEVAEPQWSPDRGALLIAVRLAQDDEDPAPLQEVTKEVQADHPELTVRQAGDVTIDEGINAQVEEDLSAAEGISLPVTLVQIGRAHV